MTAVDDAEASVGVPDCCAVCGQRAGQVEAIDAVAALRLVQRRAALLIRRGQLGQTAQGDALWARRSEGAARALAVLARGDRRLRELFAEPQIDDRYGAPAAGVDPTGTLTAPLALVSLPEATERLIATISAATTEDWYRRRCGQELSAIEVAWLAVHQAVHHIDEVELAMAHDSCTWRDTADVRTGATIHQPRETTEADALRRGHHPSSWPTPPVG